MDARWKRLTSWCGGVIAAVAAVPAVMMAQTPPPNQFVPADQIARPELSPGPLLYGAYAFVWVALLVYVFVLWRKVGRVERELEDVNRKLAKR